MVDVAQELMTPHEAAKWFRRSPSWLRQQDELLKIGAPGGQPLFHVRVCRAYVLGRLCGLSGPPLRKLQIDGLATACGVSANVGRLANLLDDVGPDSGPDSGPVSGTSHDAPVS